RGMRKGENFFLFFLALGPENELYVHGVGVADGDASLQPAEFHFPGAPERIGSSLEAAGVFEHKYQRSKASALANRAAAGTLPWPMLALPPPRPPAAETNSFTRSPA